MAKAKTMDMTTGPFFRKMLAFSLPLMAANLLQSLYNTADSVVVGRFAGPEYLAAVGSTAALCNLLLNLMLGLSVGSGVVVARLIGARDMERAKRSTVDAIAIAIVFGVAVSAFAVIMAPYFLMWMGSPVDVLPLATLYLRIFFLGAPATILYNFASAIVRANGDTEKPLLILTVSGIINIFLNLFFVIVMKIHVAGVALATVISQAISAIWMIKHLKRFEVADDLKVRNLRIYKAETLDIASIGVPSGLQGMAFSISNVLIQASVNTFGTLAVAGYAAVGNLLNFQYVATNAFSQMAMNFISQNYGAGRIGHFRKITAISTILVSAVNIIASFLIVVFSREFLLLFTESDEVIAVGQTIILWSFPLHIFCGIQDMLGYELRGMGRSMESMLITLFGTILVRIIFLKVAFAIHPSIGSVFLSYPVSWIVATLLMAAFYVRSVGKIREHAKSHGLKKAQNNA